MDEKECERCITTAHRIGRQMMKKQVNNETEHRKTKELQHKRGTTKFYVQSMWRRWVFRGVGGGEGLHSCILLKLLGIIQFYTHEILPGNFQTLPYFPSTLLIGWPLDLIWQRVQSFWLLQFKWHTIQYNRFQLSLFKVGNITEYMTSKSNITKVIRELKQRWRRRQRER